MDLSFIGTLGGSLVNAYSQHKANQTNIQLQREVNQANLELYNRQYRDQLRMWELNNDYNSPSAQMSRLKAAGLNPSLALGSNPSGTASLASAPSASPMGAAHVDPVQWNFSDVANSLASLAMADKSTQEAKGQGISNEYLRQEKIQTIARLKAETSKALQDVKKGSAEEKYLLAQDKYLSREFDLLNETYDERKKSFELANLVQDANKEMIREQARSFGADAAYKDSLKALNVIEKSYRGEQLRRAIDLMMAEAEKLSKEGNYYEELKRLTGFKADEIQKILPFVVPRVRSEIYRNTLGESGVNVFGVGAHGTRSAYDQMFDTDTPQEKKNKDNNRKKKIRKEIDKNYYNTD